MGPQYFKPQQAQEDVEYAAPSMEGRPHTPQRVVKENFHTVSCSGALAACQGSKLDEYCNLWGGGPRMGGRLHALQGAH